MRTGIRNGDKGEDYQSLTQFLCRIYISFIFKRTALMLCFPRPLNVVESSQFLQDFLDQPFIFQVKIGRIREIIGNLKYVSEIPVMTIAIAVLSTAFVAAVVITVYIVLIIRQKKIKAEKNFEMEVISREEKVRDASREGTLI